VADEDDDLGALELEHTRLVSERDRMRDARQFFARQLGPLPTVTGISLAAVAVLPDRHPRPVLIGVALGLFALMIALSVLYAGMPAYRELRARHEELRPRPSELGSRAQWYRREIELEREIVGDSARRRSLRAQLRRSPIPAMAEALWPRRKFDGTLQEQLDKERFGVFLIQFLFVVIVLLVVLAYA
jgi:hypothetical protein